MPSPSWNETANNQLVSYDTVKDGADSTGLWKMTGGEPIFTTDKIMTKEDLGIYTDIPIKSYPLNEYTNLQCPTKGAILGVF